METQTKEVEEPESSSSKTKSESFLAANSKNLGLLAVIAVKAKGLLIGLLKIKGVATFITMMINIIAYWWTGKLGLAGAVGFVSQIFVHEMGHVMALRYYKVSATAPIFIPFVGAFIGLKEKPKNAFEEAVVALATWSITICRGNSG